MATAVAERRDSATPQDFGLQPNYPNPFNSGTVIPFALPEDQDVELNVFNLDGQQVATLVDGTRPAGTHAVRWDGRDDLKAGHWPAACTYTSCRLVGRRYRRANCY